MIRFTKQLPHPLPNEISVTSVLAALSDPIRLAILATLVKYGECKWSEFDVPVCKSTLSHHMRVLREAGLLQHRREGTRCWVSLRSDLSRDFPGLLDTVLVLAAREPDLEQLFGDLSRRPVEEPVEEPA